MINHDLFSMNLFEMLGGLDVNQAIYLLTTFFLSAIARHIPSREITCSDRHAPWIPMMLKKLSKVNIMCIVSMLNNNETLKIRHALNRLIKVKTKMITGAKIKYYSRLGEKLCDSNVGMKTYWKTLHKIINKKQVMNIHIFC